MLKYPKCLLVYVMLMPLGYSYAQSVNSSLGKSSMTSHSSLEIPQTVLYKHFFAHLRQLDSEADQLDKSGKSGNRYRNYYQQHLGFSNTQFSHVRDMAYSTQQFDAIDQKAKQIIVEFRRQMARGSASGERSLPPVPQELHDLKIQRDQLLSSQITELKQQLGPHAADTLDKLIRSSFTAHASVAPVIAPGQQQLKQRNLSLPPLDNVQHQ